jgi:hypothetical protein
MGLASKFTITIDEKDPTIGYFELIPNNGKKEDFLILDRPSTSKIRFNIKKSPNRTLSDKLLEIETLVFKSDQGIRSDFFFHFGKLKHVIFEDNFRCANMILSHNRIETVTIGQGVVCSQLAIHDNGKKLRWLRSGKDFKYLQVIFDASDRFPVEYLKKFKVEQYSMGVYYFDFDYGGIEGLGISTVRSVYNIINCKESSFKYRK